MDRRRESKAERQDRIVAELGLQPAMRVADLAARLGVSTETIRRDLAELDRKGQISRTYGGAMRQIAFEPGLTEREMLMVTERQRIAACATAQIGRNDILMIGGGATTLHFARALADFGHPLTVITHAFSIAITLSQNALIKVLMLPGQYDGREGLIHGPDTIEATHQFRANIALLGASGLTAEGPQDAAIGPALIYGAMMRRSARTLVLADHAKFDRPSLKVYGLWGPAVSLVCDAMPDAALAGAIRQAGADILMG